MTTIITEGFEGGVLGHTDMDTTTAFDLSSFPNSFSYINTYKHTGSLGCRMTAPSSAVALRKNLGGVNQASMRCYMKVPVTGSVGDLYVPPTAPYHFIQARRSGANLAVCRINSDGTWAVKNGGAVVYTSTDTVKQGDEYRWEWLLDGAAGVQQLNAYKNTNSDGASADAASSEVALGTGIISDLGFGVFITTGGSPGVIMDYDDFKITDTYAYVGPSASPVSRVVTNYALKVG